MVSLPSDIVKKFMNLLPYENSDNQVCFKVSDGYRVYIPKDLLMEHSDYFKNFFSSGFSESLKKDHVVEVIEFTSETIVIVALFLCSGDQYNFQFSNEEFKNLYILSDLWQITALIDVLLNKLDEKFQLQDAGDFLLDFAAKYKPLRDKLVGIIAQGFDKFKKTEAYEQLLKKTKGSEGWYELIVEILEKDLEIQKSRPVAVPMEAFFGRKNIKNIK